MTKTAAAEAAAPHDARFELIPLDKIVESETNHRRRSWGDMAGLTESVRQKGVIEPILVRPRTGIGSNLYEIVFGARRFRASKEAGRADVPALVRELSDLEVIELQVIENLQRADVHPLEEAEGYEQLLQSKEREYTVDEIAAKVGKSRGYVYGRMKLLALCKEAREAFYEDKVSASVALLLARIPVPELQLKALEEVTEGDEYGDYPGPMSYRDAQEHIVLKYTLRLADAPFDRGDPALVASAGVCTTCPKRSGAQPELFADVKSPDLCTDPTCFTAKKDAAWKLQQEKAKEQGVRLLTAKQSEQVFPKHSSPGSVSYNSPFVKLTDSCPDDPKGRPWKQVLGKAAPEKVLARDQRGKVHELVDRAEALAAAKKAGVKVHEPRAAPSHDRAKEEREGKVRVEVQRRVGAAVVARLEKVEPDAKFWRLLVDALLETGGHDVLDRRFGEDQDGKKIDAAVAKMKEGELRAFALELALDTYLYPGRWTPVTRELDGLLAWAKVDAKEIEKDARAALKDAERAAAAAPDRWTAVSGAKVPAWVRDLVGDAMTAAQIVAKWGPGATFEKGKPVPARAEDQADAILKNTGAGALVPKKRRGKKGEARP